MQSHDPYAALRHPAYRRFLTGSQALHLSGQAISVALGFHLYRLTNSAWTLGLVGLFNYLPIFFFSLPAGLLADHVERRRILRVTLTLQAACGLGFCWLALHPGPLWHWYALITLWASARAVQTPASVSLYPNLMPDGSVANAVSWNSANFQVAAMAGPALGGLLIDWKGPEAAFLFGALGPLLFLLQLFFIQPLKAFSPHQGSEGLSERVSGGLRFVMGHKPILAALTLDLFAVLFGGVEAILPIFARDILGVSAFGLGLLRAAPFAGAFVTGLFIAHRPMRNAGRSMLLAVCGFGLCMITFALSKNFALSLAMLFVSGVMDNISVVVRQTLVQVTTPEELRGRVQAVNFLFIGSSNELGEAESGMAAGALGTVPSVLFGGIAVLFVVAAVNWKWPELRALRSLR
jgi:MFS family permease